MASMFGLVNMSGEEFSLNSGEKPAWSFGCSGSRRGAGRT